MSMDAKGIPHLLWRIITFSGSCCYRYARSYPVVSGSFFFVFFLYICFPLVFYYLLCSSPIIVSTLVFIRFYLKTKYPEFQWSQRKNIDQRSYVDVNGSNRPSLRNQKSVRRNARMEVPEWDRKDIEEMINFSPRTPYGTLFSNTHILHENSKLILDEKGRNSMEDGGRSSLVETRNDRPLDDQNSVSCDSFQGQSGKVGPHGSKVVVESTEEDEDVLHDEGKKAIEWTEDDQNNVMVLGTLESERNPRLESLMVKRRARKLFKMAVDKSLMKMDALLPRHLAPILTGLPNDPYEGISQMPGSAPSIMMPTGNPFDLPYDPHEEKPNLMADSFQQEFMTANQKEFCRHESFCRGTFLTQAPNDARFNHYYSTQRTLVEGPADPRFKWQSGNHNEATNSTEGKHKMIREREIDGIELEGENMGYPDDLEPRMDITRNNNDSCYTSSSEDTESVLDRTSKYPETRRDQMQKAFNLLVPPKGKTVNTLPYDFSPSPSSERPRPDFSLFYGTYKQHRPPSTCSIASDLQVEVSEIGSPPLTTDGMVSPVDGESVTYDGELDRDINFDGEEVWGGSFNLSKGQANRERLTELHDTVEVELSGLKRKLEDPNASPSPSEQEANNILDKKSSPSSVINITKNVASHPINMDAETHEDTKKKMEDLKYIEEENLVEENTQNLEPKHATRDAPNAVQSRDNLIENNVSGSKKRFDGSISMDLNRRLLIEQFSDKSFSSPRSVLPQNNLEDEIPLSDVEKPQKDVTPENARKLAENSIDQLSSKRSLVTLEGPSKATETTTNDTSADHMNKLVLEDKQGKGDSSIKADKGESETLMSSKDNKELSRPSNEGNLGSVEHLEGRFQRLVEHSNGVDPSKSEAKKSDDPETMVVEEKEPSSSRKVIQEGNIDVNINNSVVNVKEERGVPVMVPSKSTGLGSGQSVEDTKLETERLPEAKAHHIVSTSARESNSLNDFKNGEEIQNLTSHDGIIDAPQSKEDNLEGINHKAGMEESKTIESEGCRA